MKLYEVEIEQEIRIGYSNPTDHHFFGYKWQEDDEHVWFKAIKYDFFNIPFFSSPIRILKGDFNCKEIIANDEVK